MPKSNVEFWVKKFEANISRDAAVRKELADQGIKCIVVWECTVKRMRRDVRFTEEVMSIIESFLTSKEFYLEQ